jgi:probable selenium-dependent hydroxylase accessory protein YqeC
VDSLRALADLVLVEADGARGRSLKLPASHEPVIPSSTTLVLVVAALDVLGRPLDADRVHRLDLVAAALGKALGEPVTAEDIGRTLGHAAGYPARVPPGTRAGVFLNKAEDAEALAAAALIATGLLPQYEFVAAGSAREGGCRIWRRS